MTAFYREAHSKEYSSLSQRWKVRPYPMTVLMRRSMGFSLRKDILKCRQEPVRIGYL